MIHILPNLKPKPCFCKETSLLKVNRSYPISYLAGQRQWRVEITEEITVESFKMKSTRVENAVMFESVEYILHVVNISMFLSLNLDNKSEHLICRHPVVLGVIMEKVLDLFRWLTWFHLEASYTTETHFEWFLHYFCES